MGTNYLGGSLLGSSLAQMRVCGHPCRKAGSIAYILRNVFLLLFFFFLQQKMTFVFVVFKAEFKLI